MSDTSDPETRFPKGLGTAPTGEFVAPLITTDPIQISDGVYVIPDGRVSLVPNVGIVIGRHSALVIDTGLGPRNGAIVLDAAKRLARGRKLYVAVTQMDPGHGFGLQMFKGHADIIYSSAQRFRLAQLANTYAAAFARLSPVVSEQLDGLKFVDSDICYDGELNLDLGGVYATLRQWGPAHTADDQTIHTDAGILFGGDLFETRMFPILPYFPPFDTHFDSSRWLDALAQLIALRPQIVVPGHGEITDVGHITEVRKYLAYVGGQSRALHAAGYPVDAAAAEIEQQARVTWNTWESPQFIGLTVRAFYDELTIASGRDRRSATAH